jgi:serine/threonine protein phosphatase PrpC
MHCPACSTEIPADTDNLFCEECGSPLAAPAAAAGGCACGASLDDRDEDGFCLRCGRKNRIPLPTDHMEEALSPDFAAVTDRGMRHEKNEDRFGVVAAGGVHLLVVCDGVSSSKNAEIAASTVSEGVVRFVSEALAEQPPHDPKEILRKAIASGSSQLEARVNSDTRRISGSRKLRKPDENPPSTTVVAALVADGMATIVWVGDSRAYWIDEESAWPLTQDHSWQNDVVSAGEMTAEEAGKAPNAHAITRWIGPDASGFEPGFASRTLREPGTLLLCTDGLWNYAPTPREMAELVHARDAPGKDSLTLAQSLVAYALERGGQDNVTVAVLRVGAGNIARVS